MKLTGTAFAMLIAMTTGVSFMSKPAEAAPAAAGAVAMLVDNQSFAPGLAEPVNYYGYGYGRGYYGRGYYGRGYYGRGYYGGYGGGYGYAPRYYGGYGGGYYGRGYYGGYGGY